MSCFFAYHNFLLFKNNQIYKFVNFINEINFFNRDLNYFIID